MTHRHPLWRASSGITSCGGFFCWTPRRAWGAMQLLLLAPIQPLVEWDVISPNLQHGMVHEMTSSANVEPAVAEKGRSAASAASNSSSFKSVAQVHLIIISLYN